MYGYGVGFSRLYPYIRQRRYGTGQLVLTALNGVYEKWFFDYTLALAAHLGGGIFVCSMKFPYSDTETALNLSLNAGVSARWRLWRELFIEAGFGFTQLFSGSGALSGFAALGLGLGWTF